MQTRRFQRNTSDWTPRGSPPIDRLGTDRGLRRASSSETCHNVLGSETNEFEWQKANVHRLAAQHRADTARLFDARHNADVA